MFEAIRSAIINNSRHTSMYNNNVRVTNDKSREKNIIEIFEHYTETRPWVVARLPEFLKITISQTDRENFESFKLSNNVRRDSERLVIHSTRLYMIYFRKCSSSLTIKKNSNCRSTDYANSIG